MDARECYIQAGKIASKARMLATKIVIPGARILDIAEQIEKMILDEGAGIAFPVNISLNSTAAHYTPFFGDETKISENDYVKVDIGVHIEGYIADTAVTIRPAGKDRLIECSEKMLEAALSVIKPGSAVSDVGEVVEKVARDYGFSVVRNLSGHCLERYDLHAGFIIPNVKNNMTEKFEKGHAYAIEPFCTSGSGFVKDSGNVLIFSFLKSAPTRSPECRKILEIAKSYNNLPFAKRWIEREIRGAILENSLRQLIAMNALHPYYVLKEVSGAPVAQAEHTIFVDDEIIVTTK